MTELITTELVALDADLGSSSSEVIAHLTGLVAAAGRADDPAGLHADAMAREGQSATGLPGRDRHPALPIRARAGPVARVRTAVAEGRLRCTRRAGRPGLPDRRAGRRG